MIGLTPAQTFDTVRGYAADGGIGARLYDQMIGETAVVHGIPTIVTWNIGHMRAYSPRSMSGRLAISRGHDDSYPFEIQRYSE